MPSRPDHAAPSHFRRWLSAAAAVFVGAVLAACGDGEAPAEAAQRGERATPIAAVEILPRDFSRRFTASAVVEPSARTRLASRTSGMLEAVHVGVGDRVTEGQLLASLDLSEQRAELARARLHEEQARRDYERIAQLHSRQSVSAAEYERARMAWSVAESDLRLWQIRVAFGEVLAPLDAVVTARYVEPGEAVDAMQTLFELVSMNSLVLRLGVSELDVVHMRTGQPVPVRLDALPDLQLDGVIRRIHPVAEDASRLVTVEVALPSDAAERGVRAGFLARVQMALDPRPEVLAVPAAAIGDDDGRRYIYLVENDRLHRRHIELGVTRGAWVEVVDGVSAGEVALATNPIDMRDGQLVRIVRWQG